MDRNSVCPPVPPSVCLPVRLSVTRVLSDETTEYTADILIYITWKGSHSSFLTLTEFGGWCPLPPEILRLNWPTFSEKRRLQPISVYNVWTVRDSEKCSIIANIGSRSRAFQRARDKVRTLPLTPPNGWFKKANLSFLWIKFKFNRIKSATKFLCVKTPSGRVVLEPFPYLTVYRCWR